MGSILFVCYITDINKRDSENLILYSDDTLLNMNPDVSTLMEEVQKIQLKILK